MKTIYKIEEDYDFNLDVLAINSHEKAYKLCWIINKNMNLNFIKTKDHVYQGNSNLRFQNFTYYNTQSETKYNILSNHSTDGCLYPNKKSINYFFLIEGGVYNKNKIIQNLTQINEILLVFELNLSNSKQITPFIVDDQ